MQSIVIDTNIVLDLLVFDDPTIAPLKAHLTGVPSGWIATTAMRDELERVLGYPKLAARLACQELTAQAVLAAFDARVCLVPTPARAGVTCRDPDDQKFIDLAVHHRAVLLSKDGAVLDLRKRLAALGVVAAAALPPPSCVGAQ